MVEFDYWQEAVECALDEAGAFNKLTAEEIVQVAKSIRFAHEHYGQAMGHDVIGNPMDSEISALRKQISQQRDAAEQAERVWQEAMAVGCGVKQSQLYRDGNRIKVYPS